MGFREIWRTLFGSTGPRRDAAESVHAEMVHEIRRNQSAVERNRRAVDALVHATLHTVKGDQDGELD